MPEWVREFGEYLKSLLVWWIKSVGGGVVAVFQIFYAIKYREAPPLVSWCLLGACFVVSGFLVWRDERTKTKSKSQREILLKVVKLLSELLPRPTNIPARFQFAIQDIKSFEPIGALIEVSDQFENEGQVVAVCDSLVSAGYSHPFGTLEELFGVGAFSGKRLKFLQDAKVTPNPVHYEGQAVLYVCRDWGERNGIAVTKELMQSQELKKLAEEWD